MKQNILNSKIYLNDILKSIELLKEIIIKMIDYLDNLSKI